MSEWSGPNAQQYPSNEPDGVKRLIGVVQDVAQKARDATKNLLRTAGIFLTETGMRIESALTVNGDFASTGSADITGTTHIGGSTDIDGSTTVRDTLVVEADATFLGNLAVPNGSITNDALQNPVIYHADFSDVGSPITINNTEVELTRLVFTVPAGFAKVFVVGYGSIGVVNPTASTASIAGRIYIDTPVGNVFGPRRFQAGPPSSDIATFPYKQVTAAGLSGGQTITVRLNAINTGPSFGSVAGGASLNIQANFTR